MNDTVREPLSTLSILIVEDDLGDIGLIKAYLRQSGLAATRTASGPDGDNGNNALAWATSLAEGIAMAKRATPDIILLDLSLPDSSGLDTVRAMRAAVPDAPIVVLTGRDENSLALATLESGAQDYLAKGKFGHDALARVVRYALVRSKLERRLLHHQQHLEEEVAARTVELARSLDAAQAGSRAKSTFLANMSHELRTPLNGIMGMTSILIRGATEPKLLDRLTKIESSAKRLLDVVNKLLTMAEIDSGKMVLAEREFVLATLLGEVMAEFDGQSAAKGLLLDLSIDPALPLHLAGDAARIRHVLINLVGNAVKFTQNGRVTLAARLVSGDQATALVQFSVTDTGVGIAEADVERIFSAFEQADNSSTRAYGGTGLGLAISRHLVNLMGGRMEVRSVPGEGSTFSFTVRFKRVSTHASAAHYSSLSGVRVLVADGELFFREILGELLTDKGMTVELAGDGATATELARDNDYGLIFLDLQLPEMNGTDASRLIRQMPRHATTPIIALTDEALADTQESSRQAGMNDQFAKCFVPDQLYAVVARWLTAGRTAPGVVRRGNEPVAG